jgi:uncharacterized protein involved in outer membrane biogenesis
MKKLFVLLLKTLVTLLVLLTIGITVLIFTGVTVNLDFMRGGVELAASKALDRNVSIEGPVELEFSYWPALNVSDLNVANVEMGVKPKLLNAGFVRMQLGIFPLLKGEINIADITAENVTLNLESDADGKPNWVFGVPDKAGSKAQQTKQKTSSEDSSSLPSGEPKDRIHFAALNHLSLSGIAVNYRDAALDKNLSFVLDSLEGRAAENQPIEVRLNGRVEDKTYNLELDGGSITDLLDRNKSWGFETQGEIFGKQVGGKGDVLLNGDHPLIHLALGARDIDVGVILSTLGLVEGLQVSLGDVGMDITLTGDSLNEILSKSSMVFAIKDGSWKVMLPNTAASFDIDNLNGKISVQEGNNINIALDGTIEEVPVNVLITGAPLVEYVTNQDELPMLIQFELLETKLSFDANIKLPVSSADMRFALNVSSQNISRFNTLLGLDLPPLGPVSLKSKLVVTPKAYDLSALDLVVGESRLDGSMKLDLSQPRPYLELSLISDILQLDDFDTGKSTVVDDTETESSNYSAAESEQAAVDSRNATGKRPLSYEVLNTFDADLKIAAKAVLSGEDKLGSARVNLKLEDANLRADPITLKVPSGRFDASIDYTPSATDVVLKIRADIEEFDLGVLIRRLKPGSDMGGKLFLDVELNSRAPDVASIMEHASGKFDLGLVPENFSSGIIDLWAVNLLSTIMEKSTEKDQSVMNCVVVRTKLEDGVLKEEAIYLDTSNMRIAGKMDIDFKTRELEIKLAPKAKNPEFFSVAIPMQVKGSLDDFGLKIGILRMVGQVVSFITSPIHVPIRRVFTEASPEDGVEACTYAWNVTAQSTETKEPEKEY